MRSDGTGWGINVWTRAIWSAGAVDANRRYRRTVAYPQWPASTGGGYARIVAGVTNGGVWIVVLEGINVCAK